MTSGLEWPTTSLTAAPGQRPYVVRVLGSERFHLAAAEEAPQLRLAARTADLGHHLNRPRGRYPARSRSTA